VRTTVGIPDSTYRRLKSKAASEGRSVKALLLEAAEVVLAVRAPPTPRQVVLPLVTSKRPGSVRLDSARIYDVISFP
jgi:hypothetical protein